MTISVKTKIEQFKRDCKSVHYFTEMIKDCDERLEEIATKLEGISSPRIKEVRLEHAGNPYKTNIIELMMLEEEVVKERNRYCDMLDYINKQLSRISDPIESAMIRGVLIENKSLTSVGVKYHMDSTTVWRHINSGIKSILI